MLRHPTRARRRGLLVAIASLAALATFAGPKAHAQPRANFPAKPVTILVGFTAGGPVDVTARTIAEPLQKKWGQPVIVDVRPGANGTLAAALLAKAPADGLTLLMGTRSITMNSALYTRLPYDPAKAFVPIGIVAEQPTILVVSKSFPVHGSAEVLKAIKAQPGHFTHATTGNGSIPHLAAEMYQSLTGAKINHIPYKGGSALIVDLMSGRVDMSFAGLGTVIGQIHDKQVVPVAIASDKRSPLLPEVPTFAELGVAGYNVDTWYGLLAPAGTPPAVIAQINADVNEALASEDVKAKLLKGGATTDPVTPQAYKARYDDDLSRYGKLIRDLGLRLD